MTNLQRTNQEIFQTLNRFIEYLKSYSKNEYAKELLVLLDTDNLLQAELTIDFPEENIR